MISLTMTEEQAILLRAYVTFASATLRPTESSELDRRIRMIGLSSRDILTACDRHIKEFEGLMENVCEALHEHEG